MVRSCLLSIAACCLFLQDANAHEQPDQIHTNNWWDSRHLIGDFQQRVLRGEKDGFWAVRGKRSGPGVSEDITDQDMANYLSFLKQFLRDYPSAYEESSNYADEDEEEILPAEIKRGIMKPNGLFGALAAGKRSLVKPNGLFMTLKRGGLKPNGLFGNMGKRSYKPNGLFSLSGKRAVFKPNSLFNVHGKRSMSLKPNGFFSLDVSSLSDKRIFKPNGLFAAFKRGLKPNGLFSSYKRSMLDNLEYEDEDELLTQEPAMEKKDDKNFWAVRGKKDDDDFWAVRGKKPDEDFWAVRGKREVEPEDDTKKDESA